MTTFPGKPPPDDEASDSSWGSSEEPAERDVAAASSDDAAPPVYGVGVPYGGNDRTEEVEPIALDMPFSPEERKPPVVAAPAAASPVVSRRTPTPRPLDAPAQLALSDLFDSTPPPSSLIPPDPAAFSTPPPAAKSRWSKEPRPNEPRAAEPATPWTVSRPSGDAQYFASGPSSPGSAADASAGSTAGSLAGSTAGSLAGSTAGSTAGSAMEAAAPAPRSSSVPPASARSWEPAVSGGVVALPSINVLAEPQLPRPDSRRAPAPPASDRAELIDDFKATLPRPIALRAPGRGALLDELKETAPRPIAAEAQPPASPEPAVSSSVYQDEPDPTSKVFVDSLPEHLSEEDAAPLPSEPPPAVAAPSPSAPQAASPSAPRAAPSPSAPQRSSPHASPSPLGVDDDLKATLQRPLPKLVPPELEESEPATQRRRESEPPHRRSVPTLESVGNAAARAQGSSVDAGLASDEIARFPSDVPTSRPPDVALGAAPESAPAERKGRAGARRSSPPGERRSSNPPPQSVLAMLPSTKTQQISLPSIMLADDVEAEHDSAAQRRALRAARQTVRIELPANFGRPGSAINPGLLPGTSTALPLPESQVSPRGFALKRYAPWGLAGLLLLAAVMLLVMRPRSGSLVVTALAAGHRAVESVQIFVDGKPLCDSSPCRISGLSAGAHKLRATAPGLSSEEQTVEIASGEESAVNIELGLEAPDVQGGGLRIAAAERELTLYVDDRRVGKLPQTVSGLAAGKHWIKLDPEDGSPAIEKSVNVQAGAMLDVDPRPARRDKVVVTIQLSPDSEGASVTFDDAFLLDFPAELELDPRTQHTLTATKPGYEDYTLRVELGEETEKRIEVSLTPLDAASPRPRPRAKPSASATAAAASGPRKSATPVSRPTSSPADATQGLLNISSTPPSQIILNGRPLGSTPKTAVVVPGDSLQTIVFVHPKMGRRRAQKFVPAGKERTVSIRF